jgi:tripartite tricarboxylate transporter family receptor
MSAWARTARSSALLRRVAARIPQQRQCHGFRGCRRRSFAVTGTTLKQETRDAILLAIAEACAWIDDVASGCAQSFDEIAEREDLLDHLARAQQNRLQHPREVGVLCKFEPLSAKTQPVSGRSRCQISDIENSSSREWRRNSRPSVRDVRYSSPETGPFIANPRECAINASLYEKLNFIREIAPVASVSRESNVMVVHPSFPAKSVPEFIAYARANPGKINMASGGNGTVAHVAGELFNMMTGVRMVHVPYRGNALALTDLLGGQVQVSFGSTLSWCIHRFRPSQFLSSETVWRLQRLGWHFSG